MHNRGNVVLSEKKEFRRGKTIFVWGRASLQPELRRRGMQDFGALAFNGWDDFQEVMIEFLRLVDWRHRTELDFASEKVL